MNLDAKKKRSYARESYRSSRRVNDRIICILIIRAYVALGYYVPAYILGDVLNKHSFF